MAEQKALDHTAFLLVLAISLFTSLLLTPVQAHKPKVHALVAPITKDSSTSLYTLPLNSTKHFLIDLAGPLVWSSCPAHYHSVSCNAPICREAQSFRYPGCLPGTNGTQPYGSCKCVSSTKNPITGKCFSGGQTIIPIQVSSTDGMNPTALVNADYVSICAPNGALAGLPPGAVGAAGFGKTSFVSLPARLARDLSFHNQFVLCLPSTTNAPGVAFFGPKPYFLLPPNLPDISNFLSYTTLLKSPKTYDAAYYLNVRGLAINDKSVSIKGSELQFDSAGNGGVKLSTTIPYTTMRSNIYKRFIEAYKHATEGIRKMPAVQPFELCFNTSDLGSTRVGYGVPPIVVMLNNNKNWTIFGANSIKDVTANTACLAFVDGGKNEETAITLGGFQMEDSFLLFDVPNSTLGFIPTLKGIRTTCSNFNFTSGEH